MRPPKAAPNRQVRIEGAYNVRDLGGLPTSDGRITRFGRFLRADRLGDIPKASIAALAEYGVQTAIDLRQSEELACWPSVLASTPGIAYLHHNLLGDDKPPSEFRDFSEHGLAKSYAWTMRERGAVVRDILAALAVPGSAPAVFFCAGGTDRTGIIAALLLGIAGVAARDIAGDYHLSARGLADIFAAEGRPDWMDPDDDPYERALTTLAQPAIMVKTLDYLDREFVGVEGYVRAIGLGAEHISNLRKALLE